MEIGIPEGRTCRLYSKSRRCRIEGLGTRKPRQAHRCIPLTSVSGPTKGPGYRHEGREMRYRTALSTREKAAPGLRERHVRRVVDAAPVLASALNIWDGPPTGRAGWSSRTTCRPTFGCCIALLPVQHAHSGGPGGHGVANGCPTVIAPDLTEKGTLVPVLERHTEGRRRAALIAISGARCKPEVRAFRDWLLQMAASNPHGLESFIWSGRLVGSGLGEVANPWAFGGTPVAEGKAMNSLRGRIMTFPARCGVNGKSPVARRVLAQWEAWLQPLSGMPVKAMAPIAVGQAGIALYRSATVCPT